MKAMEMAQRLAWAPLLFQAARVLRDRGILAALRKESPEGMTAAAIAERTSTSLYGVKVLV
jgi:hypothetical protein